MTISYFPVPSPPSVEARFGQMLFLPTRSRINSFSLGAEGEFTSINIDRFLVSFKRTGVGNLENVNPIIAIVDSTGEPLRSDGTIWYVQPNQKLDQDDQLLDWVHQRRQGALDNALRGFFVDLDLGSIPEILKILVTQKVYDERINAIQHVVPILGRRVCDRSDSLIPDDQVTQPAGGYAPDLILIRDFMEDLYQAHYVGDIAAERHAGLEFACGSLLQQCTPKDPRLYRYTACDPDSANIFLFTELALILADMEGWGGRWTLRANTFACMQAIYLERWEQGAVNPRCFKQYDATSPPMANIPDYIESIYDRIRDYGDRAALLREIRSTIRRTAKYSSCFT